MPPTAVSAASIAPLLLLAFGALDMLSARFYYRKQIAQNITPRKRLALTEFGKLPVETRGMCEAAMAASPPRECVDVCRTATDLSAVRRQTVQNTRDSSLVASVVAETFDTVRGVDQTSRVEDLETKKSCLRLLKSVDKTNMLADYFCCAILLGVYGCGYFLAQYLAPHAKKLHGTNPRFRAMLSTILALFPVVVKPFWAVMGAAAAAFVPDALIPVKRLYDFVWDKAGCLPLLAQSVAVALSGIAFLTVSSDADLLLKLVEHDVSFVLGFFAAMEAAKQVQARYLSGLEHQE